MNGHCSTCDVEDKCAYPYKPCDCCNYRKFVKKINPSSMPEPYYGRKKAQVIPFIRLVKK